MLRGFRWQLLLLALASALFAGSAYFRLSRDAASRPTPPQPTPTAQAPASPPTAFVAATPPPIASSARYREGLVGSLQRINPLFAHLNPVDHDISSLIFESPFVINDYGEAVPRLASDLVISRDGLDYVMRLRDDVFWQDGQPLTASDVLFTVGLMSDPAYATVSAAAALWRTVEAQQLGERLLRMRLAQPLSSFPHLLTFGILPEHALRGVSVDELAQHPFNLSPIGSGAYQLGHLHVAEDGRIDSVLLALSPVFQRRPQAQSGYPFKELVFHLYPDSTAAMAAYIADEIDALATTAPRAQLLTLPWARLYTQTEPTVAMLIFNWGEAPFSERQVRRALSLSLDVPTLIAQTLGASATYADSPYPPGFSAYLPHSDWTRKDLAEAQAAIAAARVDVSAATAQPFVFLTEDRPERIELAQAISGQWAQLGFQFEVVAAEARQFQERLAAGQFAAAIVEQRYGKNLDLFRFWHSAQHSEGGNYGGVSEHALDELLEAARAEIYGIRLAERLAAFQAVFAEGTIAIPLYYPLYTFVARDRVEGIQLGYLSAPADRFRSIQSWRAAELAA
ncbi:MAG: ABC transporter substrate-binding protein [Chloroflexi bacterium]|nr:ABC transporter substrate-binding protein [Chloroflexota bacterium]MCY4248330.1 ABC transporter substrate-binding protein [Chloroflexota bacterium]